MEVLREGGQRAQPHVVAPGLESLQPSHVAAERLVRELLLRQAQAHAEAPYVGGDVLGERLAAWPGHTPPGIEVPGPILRYSSTVFAEAASKEPE